MTPTIDTSQWPALQVELIPIRDLIPYIRNPRQHSLEQIAQIAASMQEFGWTIPILRDEDGILIAGHGRLLAAGTLHWDVAPVTTAKGWSESKKRAYRIADNKLTINSTWDIDLLNAEIEVLAEDEFPLDLTGFSEQDLARMADDLMANQFTEAQREPQQPPQDGKTSEPREAPEQVSLVIPMSVAQREGIFQAIQKSKRRYNLDQSAEALWQICQLFLEQE